MSAPALAPTGETAPRTLDDVMLAMDVVDTLRHRERLVLSELGGAEREAHLVARLKEIYAGQGIDVPDRILVDGVKALEEKRFVYAPPRPGLARSLALFYVSRDRWLRPVIALVAIAALAGAGWRFGVELPAERRAEATRIELGQTLPRALDEARAGALAASEDGAATRAIEAAHAAGLQAIARGDAAAARRAVEGLNQYQEDLTADLSIRIVSRPGEYSGVFRIPDDNPNGRNYYLIVEAVDASGKAHTLAITSEEDQTTRRVATWGVRVSQAAFNAVGADKADDQIIQNSVIGQKPKGRLAPVYTIDAVGGAIIEW